MSESQNLIDKLLEQKSELTREIIEQKIAEKKEKIGAGYLTDQGALFLIASDYGVTLTESSKTEISLKGSICRCKRYFIRNKSIESLTYKTIFKKRWFYI